MDRVAILKTDASTLANVLKYRKHACDKLPKLASGDLILLAQTLSTLKPGQPPIRYSMEFVASYEDESGESSRIWGKQWKYILVGKNLRELENPFDIEAVKVTDAHYRDAQWLVYVRPEDASVLADQGYLRGDFV